MKTEPDDWTAAAWKVYPRQQVRSVRGPVGEFLDVEQVDGTWVTTTVEDLKAWLAWLAQPRAT